MSIPGAAIAYHRSGVVNPVAPHGARAARRVPLVPALPSHDPDGWRAMCAVVRHLERDARGALLDVSDDAVNAAQLRSWGACLAPCDLARVPLAFRGVAPPSDPRLDSTPFAFRDGIPKTDPVVPPKAQQTRYRPRRFTDLYEPWAAELIREWVDDKWGPDFARNYDFHLPDRIEGPLSREQYLKVWRRWNQPLALDESARKIEARGIVWDLRSKDSEGCYLPLDYSAPLDTHLGTDFLRARLGFTRDKSMLSQLCDVGVTFDAELELVTILCPHLIDLPPGYHQCDKEIQRRAKEGYCEILDEQPFSPWRSIMQGSVARTHEPLRPRMKADAGAPRNQPKPGRFVRLANPIVSLNEAIAGKSELPGDYRFDNDTLITTGCLGADSVNPVRPSKRRNTKLPPEIKPWLIDIMHDVCVLRRGCEVFGLKLVVLADDFADMFNQFKLAIWELWKCGYPWIFAKDIVAKIRKAKFVPETSLGFGYENASNFAQRFAWTTTEYVGMAMDEAEQPFWEDTSEMTPPQLEYISERKRAGEVSGQNELRLFSVRHMFTDDPMMLVANDARGLRLTRLLNVWTTFIELAKFKMAIATKRQLGAAVTWGGIWHIPHLGIHVIPPDKVSRASSALLRVEQKDALVTWREYRSLSGLLEHLNPWSNGMRDDFHGWYEIHAHAERNDLGPTDWIGYLITDDIAARAAAWRHRIAEYPAVFSFNVFSADSLAPQATAANVWYWFTDAALERDGGGLGGYCHGFAWRLPLEPADLFGPLKWPVTVAEYACFYSALVMYTPLVPDTDDAMICSDSLGSVDAMIDMKSKSGVMQMVTHDIRALPEFAHIQRRLSVGHCYGAGNVFADAESRSKDSVIRALTRQLKVRYRPLPVDARVVDLVTRIRERVRLVAGIRGSKRAIPDEDPNDLAPAPPEKYFARMRDDDGTVYNVYEGDAPDGADVADDASIPGFTSVVLPPVANPDVDDVSLGPESSACDAADGKPSDSESDCEYQLPIRPSYASPPRRMPAAPGSPLSPASPAAPRGAVHARPLSRVVLPPDTPDGHVESTPPPRRSFATQHSGPSTTSARTTISTDASLSMPALGAPGPDIKGKARAAAVDVPAYSLETLVDSLEADTSSFALKPRDLGRLRDLTARGSAIAGKAIPASTMKKNSGGWKWWNRFLADMFVGAKPLRDDPALLAGSPAALQREAWLQCIFYVWLHPRMKARRRRGPKQRKCSKPQSALNVVGAVRRIHKGAGCPLPPAPMLSALLRGMNEEYVQLHGDKRMLLPERKEPLTNSMCENMFSVPSGTVLSCGTVDWAAGEWLALEACVKSSRYTGWRKADSLSQAPALAAFDLTRDDLSWYLRDGFDYRRVSRLPPNYVLQPGDSAVCNPGGSKNDQQMQSFGTEPMYLPYVPDDPNNPCLVLQRLERSLPCDDRISMPLFAISPDGTPLLPDRADEMFAQLSTFALGADAAARVSMHSCRVELACSLKAAGASDGQIQAFARWKTAASVNIYGRWNPEDYADWMRRAAAARTSSAQVANLCQLDDDDAHVDLDEAIAVVDTPGFEDSCEPADDPDDDDANVASDNDNDNSDAPDAASPSPPIAAAQPPAATPAKRPPPTDAAELRLVDANPKRLDSKSYHRYELYKSATSKGEFRRLGGTAADFANDLKRGYIYYV